MKIRDQLLAAIEEGDHNVVRRIWAEPWEALATWWQPRQTCTLRELKPYVKILGDEDPEDIVAAIRDCAGGFRPVAGEVMAALRRLRGTPRVDVGRGVHRSGTDTAHRAVAAAVLHDGDVSCDCGSPVSLKWRLDGQGVFRCPAGHIEPGQVYSAIDLGLLKEAA